VCMEIMTKLTNTWFVCVNIYNFKEVECIYLTT
jgi:hypothetical protein